MLQARARGQSMRDLIVMAVVMVLVTGFVFSIHEIAQGERGFKLSAETHNIIVQESLNPPATSPLRP